MDQTEEIEAHISGSARSILIAEADVDLRPAAPDNKIFILKIGEGSLAAGGRGGGFGERKVTAVLFFQRSDASWKKMFEVVGGPAEEFEVPYHVSRLPLTMADGSEAMGYGVVEPELVRSMIEKAGLSSA